MSTSPEVLTAQFPKAVRGYAPEAVDDFVRQIGDRLDSMQTQLDRSEGETNRLRKELESTQTNLVALLGREQAIANGIVIAEQRKLEVENEVELIRAEAELERRRVVEGGMDEAGRIIEEAKRRADEILAEAENRTQDQNHRLENLSSQYEQMAAQLRKQLESQLALLSDTDRSGLPTVTETNEDVEERELVTA